MTGMHKLFKPTDSVFTVLTAASQIAHGSAEKKMLRKVLCKVLL